MDTMISTPSRRMSLRRKRNTKVTDGTESPVSKKSSPLMESRDDGVSASTCTAKSQVYNSRLIRNQTAVSPCLSSGTVKNEQSFHTPNKRQQHHTFEHQQQHSPDTPLICSQLCGTQECEVVWDCNSPGYSKDDLKRMPGGDTGEGDSGEGPVAFVAPALHRLFPRARGRPPPTTITNTTAQLDELLDQLSSRGNKQVESRACSSTLPLPALDFRQRRTVPEDESDATLEEDTSPSTSPIPGLLKDAFSQPFDISDGNIQNEQQLRVPATKDMNLTIWPDDSLWGDDLNMGICDMSEVCDTDTRHFVKEKMAVTVDGGKVNIDDQVKEISSMSTDIFDDDLFNESVIRSTQAMEEAMNDNISGNYLTNVVEKKDLEESERKNNKLSKYDNSSEHSSKSFMDNGGIEVGQKNLKSNNSYRNSSHIVSDKSSNSSSRHVSNDTMVHQSTRVNQTARVVQNSHSASTAYQNLNDNSKDKVNSTTGNSLSKSSASNIYNKNMNKNHSNLANEDSCSPVLGKTHISPTYNHVRRIRNSFRLNVSSPKKDLQINARENCSVQSVNSSQLLNSMPVNERCSIGSGSVNNKLKSNLVVTAETRNLESVSAQKVSLIYPVAGNESYQANKAPHDKIKSTIKSNYHTTLTSIPSRNSFNDCSSQVGSVTNTGQTMRGPLLRSHSTDNPKSVVSNLPSVAQRSKSSVEGDASREFGEDDEFFSSLLAGLPEDELLENPTFKSENSVLKGKKAASPQGDKCSVNTVRFLENVNTNCKHLPNVIHSDSYACRKDDAKKPHKKTVALACTTLKELPNQPQTSAVGSRAQRSLIHATPATASSLHYSRLGTSMVSCVIVDNSHDAVQEVDGQGDNLTSQPGLPTPPQTHTSDILDDDLFEDDVLTLLDEVESLYGSQQAQSDTSNSQPSLSQPLRCTQDEIARKKETAQRLREEKLKLRNQSAQHQNC